MNMLSAINQQIEKKSGLELHRDYLGISKIAGCPRAAILEYRDGITPTENGYRMSFAGYEQERSVFTLLVDAGIADPKSSGIEIVSDFDSRLRGHIDGLTLKNELLEIKSVTVDKFRGVFASKKAIGNHYIQAQLYMLYGALSYGFIIYRCRETYEHEIIPIKFNRELAQKYENKARAILAAIDAGELLPCECGHCKG